CAVVAGAETVAAPAAGLPAAAGCVGAGAAGGAVAAAGAGGAAAGPHAASRLAPLAESSSASAERRVSSGRVTRLVDGSLWNIRTSPEQPNGCPSRFPRSIGRYRSSDRLRRKQGLRLGAHAPLGEPV